ncbi:sn-glycerol-3-phosphate ABC transporter ATP-binding protein UgpC [Nakamurella antarctica]|uniref:sn-glycerol-3-phosphate ABC transporter ATP-binding protein UgpC n=1 Tax=Nakamurella antarctica TaxID=1902245 RepID=A0A3G8ZQA2_9ACTN|nr:sn-glycerol-3-phosphate ABC transporter ATP-binding protein UgpC [Nakamurella antarctica]AZI58975.1 sn-glycerol-3-phosphate ABC transporter ATP-binding protein UgpC [Nakamurella antarctica]
MATVQYAAASRIYPGTPPVRAVDKLDLDIADGEFIALVGPSGSGKSTALRMLAGLEDINEGKIFIGGRDVTNVPPKNRDIAMVFQSYALYPHMTVADNMGFALKLRGVPKVEIAAKVKEAAGLLDLERYLDRKPKALSGGQRQRVAMGRAIVREPSVFLMDEPLSNLDAKLRVETRANIAALQARLGTTTVYVTHDQVEAMTMGHRVAVLAPGGVLQQCDAPRMLYDRPVNAFVAAFIGSPSMNLTTLPVTADGITMGESTVAVPRELLDEVHGLGLKEVTFGVRPENLTLSSEGLSIVVDVVEELGAESFVHGHDANGGRIVARTEARVSVNAGSTIHATVTNPEHIHLFHPESGVRLGLAKGF